MGEKVFTVLESAKELNVQPRTIYLYFSKGWIRRKKCVKINGKKIGIPESEIRNAKRWQENPYRKV